MSNFIASSPDQSISVEPHVENVTVLIAGLTIVIRRHDALGEPAVTVNAFEYGDGGCTFKATFTVDAPADKLRDPSVLEWYRSRR